MDNIKPGEHGSTYGGNALACATLMKAIEVLLKEKMCENSLEMGTYLTNNLKKILVGEQLRDIRGKGLMIGVEFIESDIANRFSKALLKNGLIAKPTHKNIIRFSPPLVITKEQVDEALVIIEKSWNDVKAEI